MTEVRSLFVPPKHANKVVGTCGNHLRNSNLIIRTMVQLSPADPLKQPHSGGASFACVGLCRVGPTTGKIASTIVRLLRWTWLQRGYNCCIKMGKKRGYQFYPVQGSVFPSISNDSHRTAKPQKSAFFTVWLCGCHDRQCNGTEAVRTPTYVVQMENCSEASTLQRQIWHNDYQMSLFVGVASRF